MNAVRSMTRNPISGERLAVAVALVIVTGYLLLAAGVWLGLWGGNWAAISGNMYEPPSAQHWLGTNRLGQDLLERLLAGAATAFRVGISVAIVSVTSGAVLGGLAGYARSRLIDEAVTWLIGTVDAVPFYLFVVAMAHAMQGWPGAVYLAMVMSFWTLTARLVRTETRRLRQREFVLAARASGLRPARVLFRHVLPHLTPLLLVQLSLVFVAAIKAEVVLSFLGLGLQDHISWGIMIAEASQEILAGHYMNFIAASVALFLLVGSVNRLVDRFEQTLDPKQRHRPDKRLHGHARDHHR